jgi:hypothetical protein
MVIPSAARNLSGSGKTPRSARGDNAGCSSVIGIMDKPASFPSPEERQRIIERRATLMYELSFLLAIRESHPADADLRHQQLIHEYGLAEVQRMIDRMGRNFEARRAMGDHEDEWLYHDYIKRYRRWGGQRPLLQLGMRGSIISRIACIFSLASPPGVWLY